MSEDKPYLVGFNLVKGIGAVRLKALQNYFGGVQNAWNASVDALRATGLNPRIIESLLKVRSDVSLEKLIERIESQGIKIVTWEDDDYPRHLKEIDQPPPVLYVRGALSPQDEWAVAIVGTRRITTYGRQVAAQVADALARNGVTVISGLARGVDAVAHQASLEAGGRTLAVLGCGVDRIYPPENRRLAEQIVAHGALISDYPPGTPPEGANFPPRNRIISGLSQAVVVIEAGITSGALITANFAAEQGRDVFAVPGNINSPQSKGTNVLIQQGAQPLLTSDDLLSALNLGQVKHFQVARVALPADALEARLYGCLSQAPLHVDDICAATDLPIDRVSAALAMMELKGMVRQVAGMTYALVSENPAGYLTE